MKTNQPWINNVVFKLPPKSSRKKKSQDKESKTSLGHVMNRLLEEMIAKNWMSKCDQNKTAQFLKDQRIEHPHLQRQQIFSEKPWLLLAHRVKVNWRGIRWKRSTIQHLKKKTKLERRMLWWWRVMFWIFTAELGPKTLTKPSFR